MGAADDKVTVLLEEVIRGDREAWGRLVRIVYGELHSIARRAMRGAEADHPLQTTALVNEAYLRLVSSPAERWKNRGHFFSVAARAMRQVLVDQYRASRAAKRGGEAKILSLDDAGALADPAPDSSAVFDDLEALDRALEAFARHSEHQRKCLIVELHFFVGLSLKETADVLDVSLPTVKRDWEFTRAWLLAFMNDES